MRLLEPDQISHAQSMVAKRDRTNRANIQTPLWKSRLKHSAAEFQFDSAILLQVDIVSEQKKNRKLKIPTHWVWDDAREDQKPRTFSVGPYHVLVVQQMYDSSLVFSAGNTMRVCSVKPQQAQGSTLFHLVNRIPADKNIIGKYITVG